MTIFWVFGSHKSSSDTPKYHQSRNFILTLISFTSQLRQRNMQTYPTHNHPPASVSMPQYFLSSLGILVPQLFSCYSRKSF